MPNREVLSSRIGFVGLAVAAFFCLWTSTAAPAEALDAGTTRHVPASMSAKEYDAMVDDIAETVVRRLRPALCQPAVPAIAQPGAAPSREQDQGSDAFKGMGQLLDRAGEVLRSLPNLGNSLAEVIWRLSGGAPSGVRRFFLKLLLGAVLAVGIEKTMRGFIARFARAWPTLARASGHLSDRRARAARHGGIDPALARSLSILDVWRRRGLAATKGGEDHLH